MGEGAAIERGPDQDRQAAGYRPGPRHRGRALRAWKRERGGLALVLARDDALVFGDHRGPPSASPEHFSRTSGADGQARAARRSAIERCPTIRLHDLRHTHATLLLSARRAGARCVSERLGHASATITMTVYAHVLPGSQREAASRFAELVEVA